MDPPAVLNPRIRAPLEAHRSQLRPSAQKAIRSTPRKTKRNHATE